MSNTPVRGSSPIPPLGTLPSLTPVIPQPVENVREVKDDSSKPCVSNHGEGVLEISKLDTTQEPTAGSEARKTTGVQEQSETDLSSLETLWFPHSTPFLTNERLPPPFPRMPYVTQPIGIPVQIDSDGTPVDLQVYLNAFRDRLESGVRGPLKRLEDERIDLAGQLAEMEKRVEAVEKARTTSSKPGSNTSKRRKGMKGEHRG